MKSKFSFFQDTIKSKNFNLVSKSITDTIYQFKFNLIENSDDFQKIFSIFSNIPDIIVISKFHNYFALCFDFQFLLVSDSILFLLFPFFSSCKNSAFFFLSQDEVQNFIQNVQINQENPDETIKCIIKNQIDLIHEKFHIFQSTFPLTVHEFRLLTSNKVVNEIWYGISPCIFEKILIKSFMNLNYDRIKTFSPSKKEDAYIDEKEIIVLEYLGIGSISFVDLIYYIKEGKLFISKKIQSQNGQKDEEKCFDREKFNYLKIQHPFIPKYIGYSSDRRLIIEYIKGKSLKHISSFHFQAKDKIQIILKILICFQYLHFNKFIYRDLKPDNVIIDENNNPILIDFDRMLFSEGEFFSTTIDFNDLVYFPPEIRDNKHYSSKTDIYSIGMLIYFIICEKTPSFDNESNINDFPKEFNLFKILFDKCTIKDPYKRFDITNIILAIYLKYMSVDEDLIRILEYNFQYIDKTNKELYHISSYLLEKIFITSSFDLNKGIYYLKIQADYINNKESQYRLGILYMSKDYPIFDIQQSIHYLKLAANQNHIEANYELGNLYYQGELVQQNYQKAFNYFTLAAGQQKSEAFYMLGKMYLQGHYVKNDNQKAIDYFILAANQNDSDAQYELGVIYLNGKLQKTNLQLAFFYFSQSAKQNNRKAIRMLGKMYLLGIYVDKNIEKGANIMYSIYNDMPVANHEIGFVFYLNQQYNEAIHYLTLAANQNNTNSQLILGEIYNKYIIDINKSIHYYTLAADNDDLKAQLRLGSIYKSINKSKSLHYFNLAAAKNSIEALYNLAFTYMNGDDIIQIDIYKSIDYLKRLVDLKEANAACILGFIYFWGKQIQPDMNKAIYYLTLATERNDKFAPKLLGNIYSYGTNINYEKAFYYYKLSADQNDPESQCHIGLMYFNGIGVKNDIGKAIYYLQLAAKQNDTEALFTLGLIYFEGKQVSRDIHKGIYYLTRAADLNDESAQNNLGIIYFKGEFVKRDLNKAIHYLELAAQKNCSSAQANLGILYFKDLHDAKKASYYFKLASDKCNVTGLYFYGILHLEGMGVPLDINKAIYYLKLASQKNHKVAQYALGNIYIYTENYEKGIYYLELSFKNNYFDSGFLLGFIYQSGIFLEKNISKAIFYYKEASSLRNRFAKNNLAVIYKIGLEIKPNIKYAEELFLESIKLNFFMAKYNLAHLYFFDIPNHENIEKAVKLLFELLDIAITHNTYLLLRLIMFQWFKIRSNDEIDIFLKKFGVNNNKIINIVHKYIPEDKFDQIHDNLINNVFIIDMYNKIIFLDEYNLGKYNNIGKKDKPTSNINNLFYGGFGDISDIK